MMILNGVRRNLKYILEIGRIFAELRNNRFSAMKNFRDLFFAAVYFHFYIRSS